MGGFDKSICDCCVCPMQCVLEQLIGVEVDVDTPISGPTTTITGVKDFIMSTSDAGDIPVCQITHVEIDDPTNTIITSVLSTLKPIRISNGECACCEDPMTNLLKSEVGNNIRIEFINGSFTDELLGVGEGIVVGFDIDILDIYSTCAITRVIPETQQQINDPSRPSRRTTSPPTT
ncbi:hypothetical protein [Chengkuizengella sediminis]|uniref:hypothetical protein n=1 Tax=Chengkuizengella sediminis TaxID=1885917 RepID=UPI001389D3C7|nr:hypothetical protein [Chengkuizengella sediminis]NDI35646.1 hypothetical protein [Chengkuizengella sediminis]